MLALPNRTKNLERQLAAVQANSEAVAQTLAKVQEHLAGMDKRLGSTVEMSFAARMAALRTVEAERLPPMPVSPPCVFRQPEQVFEELQSNYPRAFPIWKKLFETAATEYKERPTLNLSVDQHSTARLFGSFVSAFGRGRLLDVGCGPQSMPVYLQEYPLTSIAGFDPLPPEEPHPFIFCHAVGEFIPWPDKSFETLVIATSLDHVIDLKRTLSEFDRILVDDGRLLLWGGFIPGSSPCDPFDKNLEAVDEYHLFHLGESEFEDAIDGLFYSFTKVRVSESDIFYVLRKTSEQKHAHDSRP